MAGMLNIGITGLNAAQAWLNTTSHNISNASTPGFSRQTVGQSTLTPVFSGGGFFGQGTQVDSVKRVYSQFLENQVLTADTRRASLTAYESQITQIDNLLADPTSGLSPAIQSFFNGVQEVAANPSSVPARQAMIASGESLASRFQYLDSRLRDIGEGVEGEIASTVSQINAHAKQLSEINQRILVAESAGSGTPANDLHDLRATVLSDLNKLIQVSTVTESNGSLSVFIGSGQPLVIGGQVTTLNTSPSVDNPEKLAVGLQLIGGGSVQMPETLLTGGSLGGLLEFRRDSLESAKSQLGLIAVGLSETFNAQHKLGQDLDGALGLDFFKPLSPSTRPLNGATTAPTVAFGNVANLTGDNYRLTYTNTTGAYTLVNARTGASVASAASVGLTITPPGTTVSGEEFIIEPTREAGANIRVGIGDTRLVAAAGPVRAQVAGNNTGTATVSSVTVTSTAGFATASPHIGAHTLQFNGVTNQYDVRDAGNTLIGSIAFNPATDSAGVTRTLPGALGGIDIKLAGVPVTGDRITLESNTDGVADNTNAVALSNLQTAKTLLASGGSATASYQSTYSNLVSNVGNKTSEVKVSRAAQDTLVGQATASREALSGVNLDEEAANLIRYQQAYQASARVMSIASSLFDEILSIAR
ncbi:MAG: flagellar hook-associated protein FlgK [Denitromonas halophila]|nr:MAG: flagellar hook-associated protein FlgK [Denitromonas halophila]TVT71861.1 MAG: flagellar hook-associated protein FlgK [Denitromonas halophila]TVT77014.1 MAG: flagellar hook-associated protein FlgK [Denitromonas halophila]